MNLKTIPKKVISFLKEIKSEIGRVSWPTKRETFKNTLIIIGTSVVIAVFLGGVDFLFTTLLNMFI